jgi:very-short-patch-repair endonuclease
MLTNEDQNEIIKLYNKGYSTKLIADKLNTYPNKINRFLRKSGIEVRSRSEAQKLSLEKGFSEHPTKGRERTKEEKTKIKEGMVKYWDEIDDEEYQKRIEKAREVWDRKSDKEKEEMRTLAARAMAKAAIEGSKIEKFLKKQLAALGYDVVFHKKGLVANHDLEVDIFLPNENVIIEIDGPTHFLPIFGQEKLDKVMRSDNEKNGLLISKGFTVLRFKYLAKRFGEIHKRKVLKSIEEFLNTDYKPGEILEIEV